MNAFTHIEGSLDEPTVPAVASAVFAQVRAVGEGRISFGLDSQIAALDEAKARLESVKSAKAFITVADDTTEEEIWGAYFDRDHPCGDDERPTVFCWDLEAAGGYWSEEHGFDGAEYTGATLLGAVIDPDAEYGNCVIVPKESLVEILGREWVSLCEQSRLDRLQGV